MTQLVALLRGVNLGNRKIRMDDLRQSFARAGFAGARTLLASGNVVFEGEKSPETVTRIETQLEKDFGFRVETILRSMNALGQMVASNPFAGFASGADTKFYVFFLGAPETHKLTLPCAAPGDFEVVGTTPSDIFAVAYRMPNGRFGQGLDNLGKPFGRYITNRNWNTVLRLTAMDQNP